MIARNVQEIVFLFIRPLSMALLLDVVANRMAQSA